MSKTKNELTNWQRQCLAQLKASMKQLPDTLTEIREGEFDKKTRTLHVSFALNTSKIESVPDGLTLENHESFILAIGPDDERPPGGVR